MAPQFTTVTSCLTAAEAESIIGLLRSEGIPATLADGSLNTVDPLLGPALGYVRVDVPADLLDRARGILEERVRKPTGSTVDACPACGVPLPGEESSCASCGWALAEAGEGEAWVPRTPRSAARPGSLPGTTFGLIALSVWFVYFMLCQTVAEFLGRPALGPPPDWSVTPVELPLILLGGLLLLLTGIVALTVGFRGRVRPRRATAGLLARGMGAGILFDLGLRWSGHLGGLDWAGTFAWFLLPFFGPALTVAWPALNGMGLRRTRAALGLVRGQGYFREAAIGVAAFPAVYAAEVLCDWILQPGPRPLHEVYYWLLDESTWFRVWGLAAVLVQTPLVEEVLFRGAVYRFFRDRSGVTASVIASSLLFAICHLQGWGALPYLVVFGAGAALLREWRGSLVAPMAMHAAAWAYNLVLLARIPG